MTTSPWWYVRKQTHPLDAATLRTMESWTEYTRLVTALLVILDPFAAIPIFLALTEKYSAIERKRTAATTTFTVALVLILSAVAGEKLLQWMGTSLASFRVGGGIVLLLMALALLRGQPDLIKTTASESEEALEKTSVAVVPLAIPLLAGPGAISTVIIAMHRSQADYHWMLVIACILAVCAILWVVLRAAARIADFLGSIGIKIINRLFGLLLAAIAVEIMANGLKLLFPGLAH